jgi:hypothetical protein
MQTNVFKLEAQVKSIQSNIILGKCKNVWAAKKKMEQLQKQLNETKFFNHLAK